MSAEPAERFVEAGQALLDSVESARYYGVLPDDWGRYDERLATLKQDRAAAEDLLIDHGGMEAPGACKDVGDLVEGFGWLKVRIEGRHSFTDWHQIQGVLKGVALVFKSIRKCWERARRAAEPAPEWSTPDSIGRWAKVFQVGRNKMAELLKTQQVRNKPLGTQRYMVAIADIPAIHQAKYRPPASEKPGK
jgi:hypothetical protein